MSQETSTLHQDQVHNHRGHKEGVDEKLIAKITKRIEELRGLDPEKVRETFSSMSANLPIPRNKDIELEWMIEYIARTELNNSYAKMNTRPPDDLLRGHLLFLSQNQKVIKMKPQASTAGGSISEPKTQSTKDEETEVSKALGKEKLKKAKVETEKKMKNPEKPAKAVAAPQGKKQRVSNNGVRGQIEVKQPPKWSSSLSIDLDPNPRPGEGKMDPISRKLVEAMKTIDLKSLLGSLDRSADGSKLSFRSVNPNMFTSAPKKDLIRYKGPLSNYRAYANPCSPEKIGLGTGCSSDDACAVQVCWHILKMAPDGLMFNDMFALIHITYDVSIRRAYDMACNAAKAMLSHPTAKDDKKAKKHITGEEPLSYFYEAGSGSE